MAFMILELLYACILHVPHLHVIYLCHLFVSSVCVICCGLTLAGCWVLAKLLYHFPPPKKDRGEN